MEILRYSAIIFILRTAVSKKFSIESALKGLSPNKLYYTSWYGGTRSFGPYQSYLRRAFKCVLLNVIVKANTMVHSFPWGHNTQ